jgi:hypothetical protein
MGLGFGVYASANVECCSCGGPTYTLASLASSEQPNGRRGVLPGRHLLPSISAPGTWCDTCIGGRSGALALAVVLVLGALAAPAACQMN